MTVIITHKLLTKLGVPRHKDSNRLGLCKRILIGRRMGVIGAFRRSIPKP